MKGKLAGLLISVLYVLSLFAGATALEIHALNVKPFDAVNTPVPDSIVISGTETHTWTSDGSKAKTFFLPHGTYDVTVKKAGYTDFVFKNAVIDASTAASMNVYYSFVSTPNGGTKYSVPVAVKDSSGAALTVDTLVVRSGVGPAVASATNVNTYTFSLADGDYTLVASKAGYTDATQNIHVAGANLAQITMTLTATSNGGNTGNVDTSLAITDVDYKDEVKPAETMKFDVDVKNNAAYDAENVKVTITIKGIDDGDDIDQTEEFSTLDKGEHDTYEISLDVPKIVDAKTYSFEAKVEWESEDGTEYYNTKTYTNAIEVVKEDHDVQITGTQFLSASTEAGKQNQVSVSLWNAGDSDETARIKVEIPDLKISVMSPQFKLKENGETTQYVQFNVPSDAKSGKYFAYTTVYFDNGALSNMDMQTLEVKAPAQQVSEQKVTVTPVVVTTQPTAEKPAVVTENTKMTTTGLVIAAIIVLLVIGMLARELMPRFAPKPTVIKAGRGGR